jgi:hypothetical protein
VLAEIMEAEIPEPLVADREPGGLRDQHLPAVGRRTDPRAAVNVETHVAVLGSRRLTRVGAHANSHHHAAWPRVTRERALSAHGGEQPGSRRRKRGEDAVADRIDLDAVLLRDRPADQLSMGREHARVAVSERVQQPCRPFDVAQQQRDRATRQARPVSGERFVSGPDRSLEALERRSGLDPESAVEGPAGVLVCCQRLVRAPVSMERKHELSSEALAERVRRDQGLQLVEDLGVSLQREIRLHPFLERCEPELLQPGAGRLGEWLVPEVRQRRAAPEAKRLPEACGCVLGLPGGEGCSAFFHESLEAPQIDVLAVDAQQVAGEAGDECFASDGPAEAVDVRLDQTRGSRARLVPPELVGEPLGRHDLARVEEQKGEQRPLPITAKLYGRAVALDFERAKNRKLHRSSPSQRT